MEPDRTARDPADADRAAERHRAEAAEARREADDYRRQIDGYRRQIDGYRRQYETIAELSDTFLASAEGLKDYSHELEERVARRTADLRRLNQELHEANLDAVCMLAVASEAKDADTGAHVRRLRSAASALAAALGFAADDAAAIGTAAVLHDVGKLHVPDGILSKPGPLDADERRRMREHTTVGERILADKPFFARARHVARWHHENHDGSGYPDGLGGAAVPIEARIVHLADVFDALTHARAYKPAWPADRAAAEVERGGGTMFDPEVVAAFRSLRAAGRYADAD